MSNYELAKSIAAFSYDVNPYAFNDEFDTFDDGVDQIAQLLESEPETVTGALESMFAESEDQRERMECASLVRLVRAHV